MTGRYALWSLFGPIAWPIWAAAIAFAALWLGRGPRAVRVARWASLGGLVLLVLIGLGPLGWWLMDPLETRFGRSASLAGVADIVVLAGGEHLDAAYRHASPQYGETAGRVISGAELAHALPAARLWAVGGMRNRPDAPRDVDWAGALWRGLGVAPARIVLVGGTADTCQNADAVARLLPPGARPLLVTSAFHMPRAIACFRAAGLRPIAYPADYHDGMPPGLADIDVPDLAHSTWRFDAALHEWAGLLYYRLTGRTRELWPVPDGPGKPPGLAASQPISRR